MLNLNNVYVGINSDLIKILIDGTSHRFDSIFLDDEILNLLMNVTLITTLRLQTSIDSYNLIINTGKK
jgi:hypothetical protein